MTVGWTVERLHGSAAALHTASADLLDVDRVDRRARILVADAPAVVLGSHEPEDWFDPAALKTARLELARRRSGGGAVLVGSGQTLWVDFVVPAGDPLWDDDVSRASWWVGGLWRDAFAAAGFEEAGDLALWQGPMRRTRWAPVICFAGVGPGEIELGGAKVVGVSQRRTRRGALFQSAVLLDWDPGLLLSLLSPAGRTAAGLAPGPAPALVPEDLSRAGYPLGTGREQALVDALLRLLMS